MTTNNGLLHNTPLAQLDRVLGYEPRGWEFESLRACQSTVSVAQLVEPRIVIPVVVGSSPIIHPNTNVAQ